MWQQQTAISDFLYYENGDSHLFFTRLLAMGISIRYNVVMLQIEDIRNYFADESIFLTDHVLTRMRQRKIRFEDIRRAIENGEIIEQYPTDYPFPSCLINGENIHLVCSIGEGCLYIITAYRPSPVQWEPGGRKRKEST